MEVGMEGLDMAKKATASAKLCCECNELPPVPGFRKCKLCYMESLEVLDTLKGKQAHLSDDEVAELRYDTVVCGCLSFLESLETGGLLEEFNLKFPEDVKALHKVAAEADGHLGDVSELLSKAGHLVSKLARQMARYSLDELFSGAVDKLEEGLGRGIVAASAPMPKKYVPPKVAKSEVKKPRRHLVVMPETPGVH
jgi:hypothetical protein